MFQITGSSICHINSKVFQMTGNLINTLRPQQNDRRLADDTFKRIFLNENVTISIKISLKFVPKGPVNNIPALVQIMAWRRPGDKPLSEPMMVSLLTHICVTQPQWVNGPDAKKHQSSALLVLFEGNPMVTGIFYSHRASRLEIISMPWMYVHSWVCPIFSTSIYLSVHSLRNFLVSGW